MWLKSERLKPTNLLDIILLTKMPFDRLRKLGVGVVLWGFLVALQFELEGGQEAFSHRQTLFTFLVLGHR